MSKHVTVMTLFDAEHISDEKKQEIIDSYPEHERRARVYGLPAAGEGAVYPIVIEDLLVEPFDIPSHWYRIGGLDFGWTHPTAAVELAHDRDADIVYVIKEYRRSKAEPIEHCATLSRWGRELPWAWPHDGEHTDKYGKQLKWAYADHLKMLGAMATNPGGGNSVEPGVLRILGRMKTGRFKIFSHLKALQSEIAMYHRKDTKIVKEHDDLCDAMRTAEMMLRFAEPRFDEMEAEDLTIGRHNERFSAAGY